MKEKESLLTNRVHRVRSELENSVKDQVSSLEKDISPIPTIVFDDIVSFNFDPKVKPNKRQGAQPPKGIKAQGPISLKALKGLE